MYSIDSEYFCKRITPDLFLEDKKQAEMFVCPICHRLIHNITSDTLGHLFCYNCLSSYLEQNINNRKCPIGQEEIIKSKITRVKNFDGILGNIKLKCPNKNCPWTGNISQLPSHLQETCLKEKVNCINKKNGCEEILTKDDCLIHVKICKFREVKCPYDCGDKNIIFNKLEEHYKTCPNYKISCPQKCGAFVMRKDLNKHIDEICTESYVNCYFKECGCQKKFKKSELNQHLNKETNEHILMLANTINKLFSLISKNSDNYFNDSTLFRKECKEILGKKENDISPINNDKIINNNSSINKNNLLDSEDDDDYDDKDNDDDEGGIELDEDAEDNDKINKSNCSLMSFNNSKKGKYDENKDYLNQDCNKKLIDNLKMCFTGQKKKGDKLNDSSYRLNLDKEYDEQFNTKFKLEQKRKEIMKHLRETLKYD